MAIGTVRLLPDVSEFLLHGVEDFLTARTVILNAPPQMLITDVRLHEYNGLHLVMRARAAAPQLAALVLSSIEDSVLESESHSLGATFVVTPIDPQELLTAIRRTLFCAGDAPVRPPFDRRIAARRRTSSVVVEHDRRVGERRREDAPVQSSSSSPVAFS